MSEDNSYIAAGVQEDCETLLSAFLPKNSLRFDDFIVTWKYMSFSLIYSGRKSLNEMIGFTDEVLQIAKRFMLPPHSFHMRAGGIYLAAGLYFKQPASGLVKIRLTYDDFEEIKNFIDLLREEEHFDVIYMFGLMFAEEAFLFTLSSGTYAVESYMREYTSHKSEDKGEESSDEEEFKKETFVTDFLQSTKILDCIKDVDQRYYTMKKELYGLRSKLLFRLFGVLALAPIRVMFYGYGRSQVCKRSDPVASLLLLSFVFIINIVILGETGENLPKSLDFAFPNIIKALEDVVQKVETSSNEKVEKIESKQKMLKEFAFRKTSKMKKVITSVMEDINDLSNEVEDSSTHKNQPADNSNRIPKQRGKKIKRKENQKVTNISDEWLPTDCPKKQKEKNHRRQRINLKTDQLPFSNADPCCSNSLPSIKFLSK